MFIAMLVFAAVPSLAADPPAHLPDQDDNPGVTHRPPTRRRRIRARRTSPRRRGRARGCRPKAKAYGRFCKGESKNGSDAAEGTKGTPFSLCVAGARKLLREQKQQSAG